MTKAQKTYLEVVRDFGGDLALSVGLQVDALVAKLQLLGHVAPMGDAMIRRYNFWFTVRPAVDLPGQWVAHCLDLDIVTQGTSLEHAVQMACEAVVMTIVEDGNSGRDFRDRHRAPEEYWDFLFSVVRDGERGQPDFVTVRSDGLLQCPPRPTPAGQT